MDIIIIAGMPASGKTVFAKRLSGVLDLPVLEKDAIKEELFDTLGFQNYREKQRLDQAATAALLRCTEAILESGQSIIVVNNFHKDVEARLNHILNSYDCNCIFVFMEGESDVFYQRYVERDRLHQRHLGHILQERYPPLPGDSYDYTMTREEFAEKFEHYGIETFSVKKGISISVDATYPETIDFEKLISKIQALL